MCAPVGTSGGSNGSSTGQDVGLVAAMPQVPGIDDEGMKEASEDEEEKEVRGSSGEKDRSKQAPKKLKQDKKAVDKEAVANIKAGASARQLVAQL